MVDRGMARNQSKGRALFVFTDGRKNTGLCAHGDDSVDKDSLMTGRGRGIFGAISR